MQFAHLGFAVSVIGVVLVSQYAVERDIKMAPGDVQEIAGYSFTFNSLEPVRGPNYVADGANFTVTRDGRTVAVLQAQKRRYLASGQVMTAAAVLEAPLDEGRAWAIRLHYKPFVRWIWGGAIMMALGGFLTLADRRYRKVHARVTSPAESGLEAA